MIIVPPVATAMMNRATRNALYQGKNEERIPPPACTPIAKMSGTLRPILKGKTGKHDILDWGRVFRSQHALLLHHRWQSVGREGNMSEPVTAGLVCMHIWSHLMANMSPTSMVLQRKIVARKHNIVLLCQLCWTRNDITLDLRRHLTNKGGYTRVAVKSTYSIRTEEMRNKSAAANSTQRRVKARGYLALRPIGM